MDWEIVVAGRLDRRWTDMNNVPCNRGSDIKKNIGDNIFFFLGHQEIVIWRKEALGQPATEAKGSLGGMCKWGTKSMHTYCWYVHTFVCIKSLPDIYTGNEKFSEASQKSFLLSLSVFPLHTHTQPKSSEGIKTACYDEILPLIHSLVAKPAKASSCYSF